ncbi:hypothetical protein VUR80DRAFT_6902 [Thermomyces stellatus]
MDLREKVLFRSIIPRSYQAAFLVVISKLVNGEQCDGPGTSYGFCIVSCVWGIQVGKRLELAILRLVSQTDN